MILDNLVLDVEGYLIHHPGGQFVMTRNYGRDISKYFFGGYAMIKGQKQQVHSI
jgi:cytochrome b involved in lipid metabolism